MIDPRAVAVQGLGYGPQAIALQGLVPIELRQEQPRTIGGSGRGWDDDELVQRLVREKWEVIERNRAADHIERHLDMVPQARPMAAPEPVVASAIGIQAAPVQLQPQAGPQDTAADVLLPSAADAARLARQRNDEEALLLLLLEA